jgi:uncharacterized protein
MTTSQLTIYLNQEDMAGDQPMGEVLLQTLLNLDVRGATVLRAHMGYGRHHLIHKDRLFGMADDWPLLVVAIDAEDRLRSVLPVLRQLLPHGLMTLQSVELVPET